MSKRRYSAAVPIGRSAPADPKDFPPVGGGIPVIPPPIPPAEVDPVPHVTVPPAPTYPAPCRFKCRTTRKFVLTVRNPLGGEPRQLPLEEAVLFSLEDGQEIGVETFGANEEIRITTPRPGTFAVGGEYTIEIRRK